MKIASWIFTVLSFLTAGAFVLMGVLHVTDDPLSSMIIVAVIGFCVFGFIGHILINKYRCNGGQGGLAVYILSFPAYIIPFVVLFIIILLIKLIDAIIRAFTKKSYLGGFTDKSTNLLLGKSKNAGAYVVIDGGFERVLTLVGRYQSPLPEDNYQWYNRFRDDTGVYWRSYDENETFVKETVEQMGRGY